MVELREQNQYGNRLNNLDRADRCYLNLTGENSCYCAIMVFIIGTMVNEFMEGRTGREDQGPLQRRHQRQGNNLPAESRAFSVGAHKGFALVLHGAFCQRLSFLKGERNAKNTGIPSCNKFAIIS